MPIKFDAWQHFFIFLNTKMILHRRCSNELHLQAYLHLVYCYNFCHKTGYPIGSCYQ